MTPAILLRAPMAKVQVGPGTVPGRRLYLLETAVDQ